MSIWDSRSSLSLVAKSTIFVNLEWKGLMLKLVIGVRWLGLIDALVQLVC